jgi:hypothetical protein
MKLSEAFILLEKKYKNYPLKYFKGIPKKEWSARADWFDKKKKKLKEGKVSQYKEKGPGQDTKTKKSQYTSWYEKKYGAGHSLKEKAEATSIPLNTLKQVYKRGVSAWSTGHRPGAGPEQWGNARVNAFIYKIKNNKKLNHDTDLPI